MTCILSGITLMDWTVSMSVSFLDISDKKWNFAVFWKKTPKVLQIQRKSSCRVVGARTKNLSPKIWQLFSILWNYGIFIVINQSDRPEPRKELHKITKSFSFNGLYWWKFISTTKMISRVYITLYFRNTNLLHLVRNYQAIKILTLHEKLYFPGLRMSYHISHHWKPQNKNFSVTSKHHLPINFLPQ